MDPEKLTGSELASPLIESSAAVVKRSGKLFEYDAKHDAEVMRVAIIRPCMSRGKRVRGLAPIYEPRMLAENAGVFAGWPMYMDHLTEEVREAFEAVLKEAGRSIKELGGRIVESFYDPDLTFPDDAERGYQKGGVVGKVIPQPAIREMLEADPGILNVSIHAYPTGARVGAPSWDPAGRGMLIEGIAREPMGSVDWVFRGGAGGRPIVEEDLRRAVSVLESYYASPGKKEPPMTDFSKMTPEQLREALQEQAPALAEAIFGEGSGNGSTGSLTEEKLREILSEERANLLSEVDDRLDSREREFEQEVEARVAEREQARELRDHAHTLIEEAGKNGLPARLVTNLKERYALLPSGPSDALVVYEEVEDDGTVTKDAKTILAEKVKADVEEAAQLLQEATGQAIVTGLGGEGAGGDGEVEKKLRPNSRLRTFLAESGDFADLKSPEEEAERLSEILSESKR